MADISKVKVLNGTTYNLKDGRIPNLPNNTTTYLRGDGTWATPSVSAITSDADVSDEGNYLLITPSSGGGGGSAVLITKSITQNGTYDAEDDNADGYSEVSVNVPNSISVTNVANATGTTAVVTADSVTPSATQHSIYFEFSDGTDTTIPVYYNDALLGTIITSYEPVTYGGKTVTLAQLDGVTWYEPADIPLNTQLIDYTKLSNDTAINSSGETYNEQWYYASDYTEVDPSMTFSYTAAYWFYIGVYDENKDVVRAIYAYSDSTQDQSDSNIGHGTLSGNKLTGAKYVRICSSYNNSSGMSLIRTA